MTGCLLFAHHCCDENTPKKCAVSIDTTKSVNKAKGVLSSHQKGNKRMALEAVPCKRGHCQAIASNHALSPGAFSRSTPVRFPKFA